MNDAYDIAIIGAGMAGASLAAELVSLGGDRLRVLLLEAEAQPGYHTTGRSAAFWEECYGGPGLVPLTLASGPYLRDSGFLAPRGALYIGRDEDAAKLDAFQQRFARTQASFERIGRAGIEQRIPKISRDWTQAIWQPDCADIDVAALHQHYLRLARAGGVQLRCNARVSAIRRMGEGWQVETETGQVVRAGKVANAAGAWADRIAAMAGAAPVGITPLRRTVAVLRTDPPAPAALPLTLDISGEFYFRPDSGRVWLSPHDETPSEPCDAAAEEIDVARALDRFSQVIGWRVEAVEHRWAGLRSFTADRMPAYGFDRAERSFFWFAGQGGSGIQTAPAAARMGAQVMLGLGSDAMTSGLYPARYDPARFSPAP
ncbi:NAD(P)/FAD-dependent oxidoreductase [Paraurantiacibacter namhicola]|uniref:Hydrogen cyanide synthase subunit HcnC n=1 Tax=Paraurantiacibacter namhicola TaxID=645517 RepID=A0A1C7DAW5_9SPHN|nr:FAD-dependent oxidoreductase [Paraurantiacibacter namhicola]ANU08595.1 Hydrogen cyanide synthase subunit HcnC precursor [Paraurantiacibacter namhicola]